MSSWNILTQKLTLAHRPQEFLWATYHVDWLDFSFQMMYFEMKISSLCNLIHDMIQKTWCVAQLFDGLVIQYHEWAWYPTGKSMGQQFRLFKSNFVCAHERSQHKNSLLPEARRVFCEWLIMWFGSMSLFRWCSKYFETITLHWVQFEIWQDLKQLMCGSTIWLALLSLGITYELDTQVGNSLGFILIFNNVWLVWAVQFTFVSRSRGQAVTYIGSELPHQEGS